MPAPANDSCATATVILSLPYALTGFDMSGATPTASPNATDPIPSVTTNTHNFRTVWWEWVATSTGNFVITAEGDYDAVLSIWTGACGSLSEVDSVDDDGNGNPETLTFAATNGTTYRFMVSAFSNGGTTLDVSLVAGAAAPANDNVASATVISSLPYATTVDITAATEEAGDPIPTGEPGVGDTTKTVWWTWTAPTSGRVQVSCLGADYNTILSAWTGPPGSFVQIAANDDQSFATESGTGAQVASEIVIDAVAGTTYSIMVGRDSGTNASLVFKMWADTASGTISIVQSTDAAASGSGIVDSQGNIYRYGIFPFYDDDAPTAGALLMYSQNVTGGSVTIRGCTLTGVTSGNTLLLIMWQNNASDTRNALIEVAGLSQVSPRDVTFDGSGNPVGAHGLYETTSSGATSHSHSSPAVSQSQVGLWIAVNASQADATATTPTGFTAFGFNTNQRRAYYRVTSAAETSVSAAFTTSGTAKLAGGLVSFRGSAAPLLIGSTVFGTKGTITSTRTFLANLDDTTRTVNEVGTFYIGGKLIVTGETTLGDVTYGGTTSTPQFARVGLGVAADATAKLIAAGQIGSTTVAAGNSSTAKTLDWNDGNTQLLTLTGNCTLTLSNPKDGFSYAIVLKQDATGSRTVTWPSAVKWAAGTAPTLTTTIAHADLIRLTWFAGLGASGNYLADYVLNYTPA